MRQPINIIQMHHIPETKETAMNQVDNFQNRIDELQREMNAAINAKQEARYTKAIQKLQNNTQKLHHQLQSAAYIAFKESEAYIESQKQVVENSGVKALSSVTGHSSYILLNKDKTEGTTFAMHIPGRNLEIDGVQYIVTKFDHDYAGSKVTLLSLDSKATVPNVKASPY